MKHFTAAVLTGALLSASPVFAQEAPNAEVTRWRVDQYQTACSAVTANPPDTVDVVALNSALRNDGLNFIAHVRAELDLDPEYSLRFIAADKGSTPLFEIEAKAAPTYNADARLGVQAHLDSDARDILGNEERPLAAMQVLRGQTVIASLPIDQWSAVESAIAGCMAEISEIRMEERPADKSKADAPYNPVPRGAIGSWIEYPRRALRSETTGWVQVRLQVDILGYPRSCEVTSSSGEAILEQAACKSLQENAQFFTGRDWQDQPIPAPWDYVVRYSLAE